MIKKTNLAIALFSAASLVFTAFSPNNSPHEINASAGRVGYTGSPGETTCTNCHTGTALNAGGGSVAITHNIPAVGYTLGVTYQINVTVTGAGRELFGFDFEALNSSNLSDGTLTVPNGTSNTEIQKLNATVNSLVRPNITHKTNGGLVAAGVGFKTFTFNWTAPTTATLMTFYATGNATNKSASSAGDHIYSTNMSVNVAPTVTISGTTTICPDNCTSLTANVTPTATYAYAWSNGSTSQTTQVCPPVSTTYTVTVTMTNGATTTKSVVVNVLPPSNPIIGNGSPILICESSTYFLEVTSSSGATLATYLWNNGANTQTIAIAPATTTTYTVSVTDVNGCLSTTSTTITVAPLPNPILSQSGNLCTNSVMLTADDPNNSNTYQWSNGGNSNNTQVTSAGVYTVTATTSFGCNSTASITVAASQPLNVAVTASANPSCANTSTTLTAIGGMFYNWSNNENTASINTTTQGVYTVTATDANGCSGTSSIAVMQFNALNVTIASSGTICTNSGGSTTLTASGGAIYNWSDGSTNAALTVSTVGVYTVTATDMNGCTASASAIVTSYAPTAPTPSITVTGTTCPKTLTASGGTSYLWSNGANTTSTSAPNTNTYTVTATNTQNGCTATASTSTYIDCCGFSVTDMRYTLYSSFRVLAFNTPTVSGAIAGSTITYAWDFGDGTTATTANPTKTYNTAGVYTVCLTATATAPNGQVCSYRCCRTVNIGDPCSSTNAAFSYTYNSANSAFIFAGIPNIGYSSVYTITNSSGAVVATSPAVVAVNNTNTHNYTYSGAALPAGTYNVCRTLTRTMNATNGVYCEIKYCRNVLITVSTCGAIARFTALMRTAAPFVVAFNSASSTSATTQEWSFATTLTGTYTAFGTTTNPSYTFANYGTYWVKLVINKGTSCEYTVIHRLDISQPACAPYTGAIARMMGGNEVQELTSETTLVSSFESRNEPTIQPNPTNGVFNIMLNRLSEDEVTISIVNLQGALLYTQKTYTGTTNLDIDLSKYPSGLYMVTMLTANGERVTQKVVKE